jgi:hypothetical protein
MWVAFAFFATSPALTGHGQSKGVIANGNYIFNVEASVKYFC